MKKNQETTFRRKATVNIKPGKGEREGGGGGVGNCPCIAVGKFEMIESKA